MRTLETDRLILRDWAISDIEDAYVFWSNPNCTILEGSTPMKCIDESREMVKYLMQAKNNYAIVLKANNRVIGSIGLNEDAKGNDDVRNVGYILAEEYWNKGIMTEALTAVVSNAKNIARALSALHFNNPKTERLLKKLGFKQVDIICGIQRAMDKEPHDEPYYVLEL